MASHFEQQKRFFAFFAKIHVLIITNLPTSFNAMMSFTCSLCSSVPLMICTSPWLRVTSAPVCLYISRRLAPPFPIIKPLNWSGISTSSQVFIPFCKETFHSRYRMCLKIISKSVSLINEKSRWKILVGNFKTDCDKYLTDYIRYGRTFGYDHHQY